MAILLALHSLFWHRSRAFLHNCYIFGVGINFFQLLRWKNSQKKKITISKHVSTTGYLSFGNKKMTFSQAILKLPKNGIKKIPQRKRIKDISNINLKKIMLVNRGRSHLHVMWKIVMVMIVIMAVAVCYLR